MNISVSPKTQKHKKETNFGIEIQKCLPGSAQKEMHDQGNDKSTNQKKSARKVHKAGTVPDLHEVYT